MTAPTTQKPPLGCRVEDLAQEHRIAMGTAAAEEHAERTVEEKIGVWPPCACSPRCVEGGAR
ncbi:hypothetical protein [Streptomyces sp. NPDC002851]